MKCSFTPYSGNEPYIFVSYSHKDSDKVFSILEYLNSQGFRIWYDDGIRFGYDWRDDIADHIEKCAVFMVFPTADYVASTNCQKEIKYALSNDITVVPAYLDDVELSSGMKMELSYYQALYAYRYPTMKDFLIRLSRESILQICRGVAENTNLSRNLDVNNLPEDVKLIIPQEQTVLRAADLKNTEGLKKIYIPDSVTHIDVKEALEILQIEEVYGMKGVKNIFDDDDNVFKKWKDLSGIYFDDENPIYKSVNGIVFNKTGNILLAYPVGKKGNTYILPDGVMGAACNPFDLAQFENILISRSFVCCISKAGLRYEYCGATFGRIPKLKNIIVDADNEIYSSIDGILFNKAEDELIVYPRNKTESSYVLPSNVTRIGDCAFYMCGNLKTIEMTNNLKDIGCFAFWNCNGLENIIIPNGITQIKIGTFGNCVGLKNIEIPDSVKSIEDVAFSRCYSLENIEIPNSVEYLGNQSFAECVNLKSITLPKRFQSKCEDLGLGPNVEIIYV